MIVDQKELFRWPCAPRAAWKTSAGSIAIGVCVSTCAQPSQAISLFWGIDQGKPGFLVRAAGQSFAWQPRQRRPAWPGPRAAKRGGRVSRQHFPHQPQRLGKDRIRNREPVRLRLALHQEAADAAKTGKHLARKGGFVSLAEWTKAQKQFHDFLVVKGQGDLPSSFSQGVRDAPAGDEMFRVPVGYKITVLRYWQGRFTKSSQSITFGRD